ncbi:hypothetical protein NDU88_000951 [Pleurodeles waltl]|uniref:Uncharacterized protein n=1 Tax=Pleurodeles waltl TaxID=8319 RepID=A0AAV7WJ19_PLEWA|nr:hypothetical protein NDU88_000951 [Pleurodeles waltl]
MTTSKLHNHDSTNRYTSLQKLRMPLCLYTSQTTISLHSEYYLWNVRELLHIFEEHVSVFNCDTGRLN